MRKIIAVAGTAGLIAGLGTAPALASPDPQKPVTFTINETQNFYVPGSARFTATGPLCASGTFVDDYTHEVQASHSGKVHLRGTAVYTCDDGSGTFTAAKNTHLSFNFDYSLTAKSPFRIIGGTGDYEGLRGTGTNVGAATAEGEAWAAIYGRIVS
jgi:hypothetical protein